MLTNVAPVTDPLNCDAVTIPVANISPSGLIVTPDPIVVIPVTNTSPSGLKVTPDPTRVFDLNVAIPEKYKIHHVK